MTRLPEELDASQQARRTLAVERRWALRCCWVAPLVGLTVWALAARYLLTVLYLHPAVEFAIAHAARWKPALACGVAAAMFPFLWLAAIEAERRYLFRWRTVPLAAVVAVICIALASVALGTERIRWFFVEWAKIRTPNPSFARNTLYWEARDFEQFRGAAAAERKVALVGSSQMYHGADGEILARALGAAVVEKNALAGFGPMQYLWLHDRLAERRPDVVVTWLSEFDFFREDDIPTDRLRWAASLQGLSDLLRASRSKALFDGQAYLAALVNARNWPTGTDDLWSQRGDIADLGAAAVLPLWRNRDHIRRTVLGYWSNRSNPAKPQDGGGALAASPGLELALENMRQNVGRKRFVEVNFECFEAFARRVTDRGTDLLVFEGTSHPAAMRSYDASLRTETRRRLQLLAARGLLTYVPSDQMPGLDSDDFADAYHLNSRGRDKFSRFLATVLIERTHGAGRLRTSALTRGDRE